MGRFAVFCLAAVLGLALRLPANEEALAAAGVPPLDKAWKGTDCRKVAELIASGELPQPRLKDEPGSKLLKRFGSTENLAHFRNKSEPIAARISDFLEMITASSVLGRVYIDELERGTKVSDEATFCMVHMLEVAASGLELIEERGDDSNALVSDTRMDQVKSGATEAFSGACTSVADDEVLSEANRTELLAAMARTVGRISKAFSRVTKAELTRDLTKLRELRTAPRDRESIDAMLKVLAP